MGIFGKILGGIFGKKKEEQHEEQVKAPELSQGSEAEVSAAPAAEIAPEEAVDVSAVLSAKAAANAESLDWKTSIVDLLKLLGIDSSYGARKELAAELGISGYEGTAEQNISMHKVVLKKLAENGGIVPAELLD